jgi:lipopolysaccharide export system protein LptA
LNDSAGGTRSGFIQYCGRRTLAAAVVVVVLLLANIVNCRLSEAQTSSRASGPAANGIAAQQTIQKDEKIGKTAVGEPKRPESRKDKSAADSQRPGSETPFGALAGSKRGPISIQSDSLALDYKHNGVLFDGHVHATQADAALTSKSLRVKYGKDFHEVQDMAADGNVHISQGVRWCTSDHAVMDQRQHTVILTGSPACHDGGDQITGTRITVHLDTGKSDVEAAKAVIFPQQSKTRDNEALADHAK